MCVSRITHSRPLPPEAEIGGSARTGRMHSRDTEVPQACSVPEKGWKMQCKRAAEGSFSVNSRWKNSRPFLPLATLAVFNCSVCLLFICFWPLLAAGERVVPHSGRQCIKETIQKQSQVALFAKMAESCQKWPKVANRFYLVNQVKLIKKKSSPFKRLPHLSAKFKADVSQCLSQICQHLSLVFLREFSDAKPGSLATKLAICVLHGDLSM